MTQFSIQSVCILTMQSSSVSALCWATQDMQLGSPFYTFSLGGGGSIWNKTVLISTSLGQKRKQILLASRMVSTTQSSCLIIGVHHRENTFGFLVLALGIKPRNLNMLDKHPSIKLLLHFHEVLLIMGFWAATQVRQPALTGWAHSLFCTRYFCER